MSQRPSIDRPARDRVASALVAYLHGEIDYCALDEATQTIKTDDPAVRLFASGLWFLYDDLKSHPVSTTPEAWEGLRRMIAFLRSDLPLPRAAAHPYRRQLRVVGWVDVGAILTAGTLAWVTANAWWLLLPGALVGLPVTAWSLLRDGHNDPLPYYPFESEADWRRHERLLDADRLPPYDPARHARPIRGKVSAAAMYVASVPTFIFWALVAAPLLAPLTMLRRTDD